MRSVMMFAVVVGLAGCAISTPEQQYQSAIRAQQLQQLSSVLQGIGVNAGNLAGTPIPYGYFSGNRPTEITCNNLGSFTTCSSY